uniref:Cytochrome c oxidase subunit 2 n=1 Tax=Chelonus formosanus TaxID=2739011 RepID=A0A8K1PS54_9HYME|nr:cytochrome c oxidase subunit II [Chelonus formosanus]UDP58212.1 cytochrome c oxidase subunit 2 [Chelonus formosanus]UHY94328.1 cytochrome c oxidase subunit II [Chelonus formosanus]
MEIAMWMMMNFQDCSSFISLLMNYFHDFLMMILLMIIVLVMYMFMMILFNKLINLKILHNQFIEIIWTIIPMFILMYMVLPSLKILYLLEEVVSPYITLKVLGHQWYWSYEYSDFKDLLFDSYMISDLENSDSFRLMDVDNRVVLPNNMNIRFLISSMDVIHSWTLPSLGFKVDAIPGRLNQIMMNSFIMGLKYGQCSEICGMNHSFMPIVLEMVNLKLFLNWLMLN